MLLGLANAVSKESEEDVHKSALCILSKCGQHDLESDLEICTAGPMAHRLRQLGDDSKGT